MRREGNWSLEEFADNAKLRFQLVNELEGGLTDPKLSTLERFSKGNGIELSELIARAEEIRDGG